MAKKRKKPRVKTGNLQKLLDKRFTKKELAEIQDQANREIAELTLQGLRNIVGITQSELAERIEMAQAQISKVEKRRDVLLSTLKKVVEGLGGHLVVTAEFGDTSYRIRLAE